MADDDVFETWLQMLERTRNDVIALHHHRQLWRETRPRLEERSDENDVFLRHYNKLYVDAQTTGLRRLDDHDPRSASLRGLLQGMRDQPQVLTVGRHLARTSADDGLVVSLRADFLRDVAAVGTEHLDPRLADERLTDLLTAFGDVRQFVNKAVAHRNLEEVDLPLTYAGIDEAIDAAATIAHWCSAVLTCSDWAMGFEPVIHGDWKRPLRQPLFETIEEMEERMRRDRGWP